MGMVFRRKEWHCRACKVRLRKKAEKATCEGAGHAIEVRLSKVWWVKYRQDGKDLQESSGSRKKSEASDLLAIREGDIAKGVEVNPAFRRLTFNDGLKILESYQETQKLKNRVKAMQRINKHLVPYFGGWRLARIDRAAGRKYVQHRKRALLEQLPEPTEQQEMAWNASLNRELQWLSQIIGLTLLDNNLPLAQRPVFEKLPENDPREGYFRREDLGAAKAHLRPELHAAVDFMFITSWRLEEVLPLEWRNVDLAAGFVKLEDSKNGEPREFPITMDLRAVLNRQQAARERMQQAGHVVPWVFFREVGKRGGRAERVPKPIKSFRKAWTAACRKANAPARLFHDLRRTAITNFIEEAELSDKEVMKLSGHQTRDMLDHYHQRRRAHLLKTGNKLDAADAKRAASAS